jgi:spore coat protein U-like protein
MPTMSLSMRAGTRCRAPWLVAAVVACALVGTARPAEAACALRVDAGVAFGAYSIFSPAPVDTAGQFDVRCTGGDQNATLTISLSAGLTGTYAGRRLTNGAEFLVYNLYRDAARTIVWGDGTGGTQVFIGPANGPQRQFFDVYGRIQALQDAAVGAYADTIVITVNF